MADYTNRNILKNRFFRPRTYLKECLESKIKPQNKPRNTHKELINKDMNPLQKKRELQRKRKSMLERDSKEGPANFPEHFADVRIKSPRHLSLPCRLSSLKRCDNLKEFAPMRLSTIVEEWTAKPRNKPHNRVKNFVNVYL